MNADQVMPTIRLETILIYGTPIRFVLITGNQYELAYLVECICKYLYTSILMQFQHICLQKPVVLCSQ